MSVLTGLYADRMDCAGDIVHVFCRADDPAWAAQALGEIAKAGKRPLLTVEPRRWPTPAETQRLASIVSLFPGEVWVRFAHEMNGDWSYPWQGSPGRFRAEWARFFAPMPGNARSVWSPNVLAANAADPLAWLPDARLGIVALDGYARDPRASFGDVFGATVARLREAGHPVTLVAETACPRGQRQRRWVEGMWAWLAERAPEVEAVVYFNQPKEMDWELGPSARRAFLGRGGGAG